MGSSRTAVAATEQFAARVSHVFRTLFERDNCDYSCLIAALRECLEGVESGDRSDWKLLGRTMTHLLFLMEEGEAVFWACSLTRNSWMNPTLCLERVTRSEGGLRKIYATIALGARAPDPRAFHEYILGPSVVIYNDLVTVRSTQNGTECAAFGATLGNDALTELFRNRHEIGNTIRRGQLALPESARSFMREQKDTDRTLVREAFADVMNSPATLMSEDRVSHPYRRSLLHILPRLIEPPSGTSILKHVEGSLALIQTMGFGGIMMGVVDRQSTSVYFGDGERGTLVPYVNNHGYWSSGEIGIDPMLGSEGEYRELVARCGELGMVFMQDSVLGTLGYPSQVEQFSLSEVRQPTLCVMLGEVETNICDPQAFLHELCIAEEDSLDDSVEADHYAAVIMQTHLGSPFALPKPNLFRPEVRAAVLQRSKWQIANAGVVSFRIDMAKHMGAEPLRSIIDSLRNSVARIEAESGNPLSSFCLLLEYWTIKYRDIRFATTLLGERLHGIYFYDFPLAHALQQVFVNGESYAASIGFLISQRKRWNIELCQLIPVFIDHDFNFRPLYNGSYASRAAVVAGYAMSAMLSANAPYVYFGYENANAGVPDISQYAEYTEQFSRKMVREIFSSSDPASPADPIASLFKVLEEHGVLNQWDGGPISCQGDADWLVVSRVSRDGVSGATRTVRASFSRFYQEPDFDCGAAILYEYRHGPSVVISIKENPG